MTGPSPAFLDRLAALLRPDQVLRSEAERWAYGYDNSRRQALPDLVCFPESHDEVREVVRLCHRHRVPLIPRGRGTGTTGAVVPEGGGVVLSTERMTRMEPVNTADRYVVVEPGVTNADVQAAAAACGFFWAPDPTSAAFSSVGGNLAYNSAGPRAVKYGTPRENTLGLRAVTGDGRELRTGVHTTKGVVGYDLTRLIIGSEGTLAVITEATLKLTPLPGARRTLRLGYTGTDAATEAITRIMAQPVVPCAVEFMDAAALDLVRAEVGLPGEVRALLLVEVDGTTRHIDDDTGAVLAAARVDGLAEARQARTGDEAAQLWAARKALSPALRRVAPDKINEDVVVPVSALPRLVAGLEAIAARRGIAIVNFGHAGNGNLHVNLLYDAADSRQRAAAHAALDDVFALVLDLDGTLSGEHGVGIVKRDHVIRELDPEALALMHQLKAVFDPAGILNPGKTLPAPGG